MSILDIWQGSEYTPKLYPKTYFFRYFYIYADSSIYIWLKTTWYKICDPESLTSQFPLKYVIYTSVKQVASIYILHLYPWYRILLWFSPYLCYCEQRSNFNIKKFTKVNMKLVSNDCNPPRKNIWHGKRKFCMDYHDCF